MKEEGTLISGLHTQFWGKRQISPSKLAQCDVALERINETVANTKLRLKDDDRKKIVENAKEVICWKLIPDDDSYKFIGFFLDSRGLHTFTPMYLFVQDNIIYGYDFGDYAYKFSLRLNYESFTMIMNVIQSESYAIAPSHEVMLYIKEEMKNPTKDK